MEDKRKKVIHECPTCGSQCETLDMALAGLCPQCLAQSCMVGGAAPAAENVKQLGGYELQEEMGRGGMGVVYRARQIALNRPVALKVLIGGAFAREEFAKRFRQEAEMAARLRHPHIVTVHEVGQDDDLLFYAMELVEGISLGQWEPGPGSKFIKIAAMLSKVTRAVAYAHGQGVLHRDLKPSNILLDATGEPRIADFGLAKPMGGESELTITNEVLGSPPYMSPEQASGKKGAITLLSDVYSLGAILYFLLTGRPPFQGETLTQILSQVAEEIPVSPRRLNAAVPVDLETICLRCLEKDPSHRYASAGDLADDLDRFARGEPVKARPVGPLGKCWRWSKRNPALAAAFGGILLILVSTVWLQWSANRRLRAEIDANRRFVTMVTEEMGPMLEPLGQLDLLQKPVETVLSYYEKRTNIEADTEACASYGPLLLFQAEFLKQKQGQIGQSEALVKKAHRLLEIAYRREPKNAALALLYARACQYRGWTLRVLGQPKDGVAVMEQGLSALRNASPEVAESLPFRETHYHLAAERSRADSAAGGDGLAAALQCERLAWEIQLPASAPGRKRLLNRWLLSIAKAEVAAAYKTRGDAEGTLKAAREFEEIVAGLLREWPEATRWEMGLSTAKLWVGAALFELGRHPEALEVLQENAEVGRRLSEHNPGNLDWHYHRAVCFDWLGRAASACGEGDRAREAYTTALEAIRAALSGDGGHTDWVNRLQRIAENQTNELTRAGDASQAIPLWSEVISARERQIGLTPNAVGAFVACGDAWLKRANLHSEEDRALAELRQGADWNRDDPNPLYEIVRARCRQGLARLAIKHQQWEIAMGASERAWHSLEALVRRPEGAGPLVSNELPIWLVEAGADRFTASMGSSLPGQAVLACQELARLAEDFRCVSVDQTWTGKLDEFLADAMLTLAKSELETAKRFGGELRASMGATHTPKFQQTLARLGL